VGVSGSLDLSEQSPPLVKAEQKVTNNSEHHQEDDHKPWQWKSKTGHHSPGKWNENR